MGCQAIGTQNWEKQQRVKERRRMLRLQRRATRREEGIVIRPEVAPGFSDDQPDLRDIRLRGFDSLQCIFPDASKETLIQALLSAQDVPCSHRATKACVNLVASGHVKIPSSSKLSRARSTSPAAGNHCKSKNSDGIPAEVPSASALTRAMTQPAHDSSQAYMGLFGADAASLLFVEALNPGQSKKAPHASHLAQNIGNSGQSDREPSDERVSERSRKKARIHERPRSRLRKYSRGRVDSLLLRAAPPSKEILTALENAKITAAAVAAAEAEEDATLEETSTDSQCPWNSWDALQKKFLAEHGETIRKELGQAVQISPLNPSNQEEFRSSCENAASMPLPAYHGTKSKNIASISSRGLLIPGHGGVRVAHGSAHGVGIYTAKLGCANLSRSFCDSDKIFICGVCDEPDDKNLPVHMRPAKWTCGMSRHHRQHHQPHRNLPRNARQKMLGNFQLHKDGVNVRHVGNAMVVFDEARVAPLFLATGIIGWWTGSSLWGSNSVSSNLWPSGIPINPNRQGRSHWVGRRRTFIKETEEVVWLPPEPTGSRHDVRIKRCVENKRKKVRRQSERDTKFEAVGQLLHWEFT